MEKVYNKKYIVGINHNGKEIFYDRVNEDNIEFVGIRSKARKFSNEGGANFVKVFLKGKGYDAWVETFYVLKEELKID